MASAAALVDKATSDLLIGPDWAMNLDICDVINGDPGLYKAGCRTTSVLRAMATHSRASLLAFLEEKDIETKTYDHPKVLTVEEQASYVGHLEGGHSKNLLLKDKKNRLILISALTTTKIDMKVLSQRLGLGKAGVRLAPEDTMQAVLKVPLGCVTPFALLNESARSVCLLLDEGFKSKPQLYFHPLSNDATTGISPSGLEAFLRSIGQQPAYVNLEEVVVVGKDQPPDLAVYLVDATAFDAVKEQNSSETSGKGSLATSKGINEPAANPVAKSKGKQKDPAIAVKEAARPSASDVQAITASILDEFVSAIHDEMTAGILEQRGKEACSRASGPVQRRFGPDLEGILMALKNTAYTEGFVAGIASCSLRRR